MGGSSGRGNATPAAEFNMAADPEAAAIVFRAGWTVTMVGLDVTLQARATPAVRDRMRGLGALAYELLLPGLEHYASDEDPLSARPGASGNGQDEAPIVTDPAVHDVCATAYVADHGLLGCLPRPGRGRDHRPLDLGDDGDRLPCAG